MKVILVAENTVEGHTSLMRIASQEIEDGDIIGCLELLVARLKNLANPTQAHPFPQPAFLGDLAAQQQAASKG